MQQNTNGQATQPSSNPFIVQRQQRRAKYSEWGLDEFENIMDRQTIRSEAEQRIFNENITDDAEKHKIYEEVKAQYREYLAYLKTQHQAENNKELKAFQERLDAIKLKAEKLNNTSDETPVPFTGDITEHPEYVRGYQAYFEYQRKQEEQQETPYRQGFSDACQEALRRNEKAAIEDEAKQNETTLPDDFMENNAIQRIKEALRGLDERLKKLEKYAEE